MQVRVHSIQTGSLVGNETFLEGSGWGALFRRRRELRFPCFAYILEHPEGLIAIDTGMSARGWPTPGPMSRFVPRSLAEPSDEIGPRMKARGLRPEDVRRVILTHVDPDHIGGIEHFRDAELLVHRREHDFACKSRRGRLRARPQSWPAWFAPTLYDLDPEPYGPFPKSKVLGERGDIRVVPLPGHTIGQVGVIVEVEGATLFFAADHTMSKAWFDEDGAKGRLTNLGIAAPKHYAETDRRVRRFLDEVPAIMLPAHDPEAPARLAAAGLSASAEAATPSPEPAA